MSQKEPWFKTKGWWLILLIVFIGFIAWKAYPYIKMSETIKKLMKRPG